MPTAIPSEAEVIRYMDTLSNWGRWGNDDELGALNFITPEKRQRAAQLVHTGTTVTCSRPIVTDITADTTYQPMRFMIDSGEGRDTDPPERVLQRRGASEFIGMVFHGYTITHVDSLAHYFWQGKMYNGRPSRLVTSREGAQANAIELLRDGVVTRGVLLDIPRLRGIDWMTAGEGVMPEDLEAAERACGVTVETGDVLLIRTGYYRQRLAQGAINPGHDGSPAAHVACAPWFHKREIAMLGTDTHNDVSPLPYPNLGNALHVVSLVAMGLWLIDNCNLEELAQACATHNRWEFMLTICPLRLRNVTGSPVNPVAIF